MLRTCQKFHSTNNIFRRSTRTSIFVLTTLAKHVMMPKIIMLTTTSQPMKPWLFTAQINVGFSISFFNLNLLFLVSPNKGRICNREFKCISNLIVHLRTHTGDKPYECKYCGKRFASAGNKMAHMKRHIAKKHYSCQICKTYFKREE